MLRPCGNFKKNYIQDEAIFQTMFIRVVMACLFSFLIMFPFISSRYILNVTNIIGIFIIGALGLNILTGFTGIISLGHGAFVGLGAYLTTLLTVRLGVPFLIALPVGAFLTAFLGLLPGLVALRIKGMYLAIATLAVQIIFAFVITETPELTGGDLGLASNVPLFLAPYTNSGQMAFYYLVFGILVALTLFARNLFRTKVGRLFVSIRDNDLASQVIGIPVGKYRLMAFWISSFYAGLCGGLWAGNSGVISPDQFSLMLSLQFLSIILIGGIGSIQGSIYGSVFVLAVPEVLANLSTSVGKVINADITSHLSSLNNAIFGLLIIIFLIYEPHGLARIWVKTKNYFKLWPFSYFG